MTKFGPSPLEWEIEGITGHRVVKNSRGMHFEYKIAWRDCAETTWEVASRLKHAPDVLFEYRTKNGLWLYVKKMKM